MSSTFRAIGSNLSDRARRWLRRRGAYRDCFMDPMGNLTRAGQIVTNDLARFCDAYRSTVKANGTVDPFASAVAQGRREVWLRIQASLRLPDDAVLQSMENDQ